MNNEEQNNMSEQESIINEEEIITVSPLNRLIMVFTSPTKAFKAIKQKPNILLPALVTGLVVLLFFLIFMQQHKEIYFQLMEQQMVKANPNVTSEMINTTVNFTLYSTIIVTPIFTVAAFFLSALYYWVFVLIFSGEGKYKHFASLIAHVGLISLLQYIVRGIMIAITGDVSTDLLVTSAASLLPISMKNSLLYFALTKIEVFNIWRLIVIIIGLKEISRLKNYKVYIIAGVAFFAVLIYTTVSLYMSSSLL